MSGPDLLPPSPTGSGLHVYRYGQAKLPPGLSLGIARHLPRGVRRADYIARGYFQLWLPLLAPSRELLAAYQRETISFPRFAARYRQEMRRPEPRQLIRLLAAVARQQRVNLGCYCQDPAHCHRTLLQALIAAEGATSPAASSRFASPACLMPEIPD